jgi:hypothetical protein
MEIASRNIVDKEKGEKRRETSKQREGKYHVEKRDQRRHVLVTTDHVLWQVPAPIRDQ